MYELYDKEDPMMTDPPYVKMGQLYAEEKIAFFNGLPVFRVGEKLGYVNKYFEIVIPCIYDKVNHFYDSFAWVRLNGKWGAIDTNGNELVPLVYDDWGPDDDEYSVVLWKGYWSFIKIKGHVRYWED